LYLIEPSEGLSVLRMESVWSTAWQRKGTPEVTVTVIAPQETLTHAPAHLSTLSYLYKQKGWKFLVKSSFHSSLPVRSLPSVLLLKCAPVRQILPLPLTTVVRIFFSQTPSDLFSSHLTRTPVLPTPS
jgi:hypothetical protein